MDLHIATASQLIGTAVSTVKTIRELAKDSSDKELKAEIGSLYDTLNEIRDKVLDLTEENRSLKTQLAVKGEIEGPIPPHGYFHYKDKPDNPLCPKCLQGPGRSPVYLSELTQMSAGQGRECHVCGFFHIEVEAMEFPRVSMGTRRRSV